MVPSPAPSVCRMLLVRHGATAFNLHDPPILQGRGVDLELSAEGREQARCVAEFLSTKKIDAVFSSRLKRAEETARRIAQSHGLDVTTIADLVEVDVGRWEGRDWNDIKTNDTEAYRLYQEDPGVHGYAGGENLVQVRDRVFPVLSRLAVENLGRTIVVVAHKGVNRAFLAHLLGLPWTSAKSLEQDNGCVNVVELKASGEGHVVTLNAVFHLENGAFHCDEP